MLKAGGNLLAPIRAEQALGFPHKQASQRFGARLSCFGFQAFTEDLVEFLARGISELPEERGAWLGWSPRPAACFSGFNGFGGGMWEATHTHTQ